MHPWLKKKISITWSFFLSITVFAWEATFQTTNPYAELNLLCLWSRFVGGIPVKRARHKAHCKARQEGEDQGVILQLPGPQGAMALVKWNVSWTQSPNVTWQRTWLCRGLMAQDWAGSHSCSESSSKVGSSHLSSTSSAWNIGGRQYWAYHMRMTCQSPL